VVLNAHRRPFDPVRSAVTISHRQAILLANVRIKRDRIRLGARRDRMAYKFSATWQKKREKEARSGKKEGGRNREEETESGGASVTSGNRC